MLKPLGTISFIDFRTVIDEKGLLFVMDREQRENDRQYPVFKEEQWRERFEFYDAHGAPNSAEGEAALSGLTCGRHLIEVNYFGLSLGPIYLMALGMWRRALSLFGIAFLAGLLQQSFVVLTFKSEPLALAGRAISIASSASALGPVGYFGSQLMTTPVEVYRSCSNLLVIAICVSGLLSHMTVNYSYYLKKVKGDNGWNPFKGVLSPRWLESPSPVFGVTSFAVMLWLAGR